MSQSTHVIADGDGGTVLAAINAALAAIVTQHSGSSRPTYATAGLLWVDTATPGAGIWTLKLYDGTSDISIGTINSSTHAFTLTAGVSSAALDALLGTTNGYLPMRVSGSWTGKLPSYVGGYASFSAQRNASDQTIPEATWTKLTFTTESWDNASFYDAANAKFLPLAAGNYVLRARAVFKGTTGAGLGCYLSIYKNGSEFVTAIDAAQTNGGNVGVMVEGEVSANGSTDYFEVYAFCYGAGGAGVTLDGATALSGFNGR